MARTVNNLVRTHLQKGLGSNAVGNRLADAIEVYDHQGVMVFNGLTIATNPTAGDTVTIGADVYEFRAAAASLGNDAHIAVAIGADAAASRANLIAAINTVVNVDNEHPTIFLGDGTTPAKCNGTERVVAEQDSTTVVLRLAPERGASPVPERRSLVVGETLTAAADVWVFGNVDFNSLGCVSPGPRKVARFQVTITAAMLAYGGLPIDILDLAAQFDLGVEGVQLTACSSAGVVLALAGDTVQVAGGGVIFGLNAGGAPNLVAGDILYVTVWGQ